MIGVLLGIARGGLVPAACELVGAIESLWSMIVSAPTKKLVLNLRNPARVTALIPHAKHFKYRGADLVSVPHKIEETQVLRNLGFNAPSPVEYHYSWPGQYTPFKAQIETTAFLTLNNRAFCLNGMGSGKTLATLWAYDYLKKAGLAHKMLIVAPLSTLERTWADEIFNNFPNLTWSVVHGSRERREALLKIPADIYLINHDGIKVMEKALIARKDIDVVTIDEIASFRNASTDRWKSLSRVILGRARVWGLTGTPTPNEPTDAWAQCRLISPERVPRFEGAFKDQTMRQVSKFKWVPRDNAIAIVAEAMQPAIRFSREQCVDLPPCLYATRHVELSPDQKTAYKAMLTTLLMEHAQGDVLAVNEAVKLGKLIQIACGVVYSQDGTRVSLGAAARISELLDIIEQAESKVIVFVPYTGVLEYVTQELAKHHTVAVINGAVPKSQRDAIFSDFQRAKDPQVIVAQPAAMSHGLTLTAANTIAWYAPTTSAETYAQANARVSRPGQKFSQLIVNIEGSPAERKLFDGLRGKLNMQGILLNLLQEVDS